MRYLLPALVLCGCAVDPDAASAPDESEVSLSLIAACPAGQWCIETAPVAATLLHAVWAINANDVFAVGDRGTILRRLNNTEWTAMESGTDKPLRSVWGSSSSDVWAGGQAVLLHFDGARWSTISAAITEVDAIWGSRANDVWFAGSGSVLHWDGAAFAPWGFGGTLLSISGTGPYDVWVTGENTNLHWFDGSTWTTIIPGAGTSTLLAVLAIAPNDVWVTSFISGKESMHWNGSKWAAKRTGGGLFQSLSAVTANDIWGAGNRRVGHWNGTAWTTTQPFGDLTPWSVTTTAGNVWIVGDGSLIAHRTF